MKRVAAIYQELWKAIDLYEDHLDGGFLRHRPPPPAFEPFHQIKKEIDPYSSLQQQIRGCQKCSLAEGRPTAYPGQGENLSRLMIICEKPDTGQHKSGLNLENYDYLGQWIKAIGLDLHQDCLLTFLTRCRPAGLEAGDKERLICLDYLKEEIRLYKPSALLILGQDCAASLLKINASMEILRSALQNFQDIPAYVSFHPATVLQNKAELRKPVWEDLKKLRGLLQND